MDGYDLTALIFAREINGPLTSLVKQLDRQLDERPIRKGADRHGVFVIFCNADPAMQQKLQAFIAQEKLKHVVLCTNPPDGPKRYAIAREADVTAVVYDNNEMVTANFSLRKGVLDDEQSRAIIAAVNKVLPKK